jgi:hypothetical protein
VTRRDDLEERALKLILDKADEGILQRDMWRELGGSSREGSRISLSLEAKNLIKRERELSNGRWTHRLYATIRRVTIDSLIDVPCFLCEDIRKCDAGADISSLTCTMLTQWLLASSRGTDENDTLPRVF